MKDLIRFYVYEEGTLFTTELILISSENLIFRAVNNMYEENLQFLEMKKGRILAVCIKWFIKNIFPGNWKKLNQNEDVIYMKRNFT